MLVMRLGQLAAHGPMLKGSQVFATILHKHLSSEMVASIF